MKDLKVSDIEIKGKLDKDGEITICFMECGSAEEGCYLTKNDAIEIMLHLNAVFNLNII